MIRGRLAVAVGAQQRDAVVGIEAKGQLAQHCRAVIADIDTVGDKERRGEGGGVGKFEGDAAAFLMVFGDGLHVGQHLHARLRLLGLGRLVAEAIHELLDAGALGVLLGALLGVVFEAHAPRIFEAVIAALIEGELAALQVEDFPDHPVEQSAVVADQDESARVTPQVILQPQARFQVQVVGGLVQQQEVGLGEQ